MSDFIDYSGWLKKHDELNKRLNERMPIQLFKKGGMVKKKKKKNIKKKKRVSEKDVMKLIKEAEQLMKLQPKMPAMQQLPMTITNLGTPSITQVYDEFLRKQSKEREAADKNYAESLQQFENLQLELNALKKNLELMQPATLMPFSESSSSSSSYSMPAAIGALVEPKEEKSDLEPEFNISSSSSYEQSPYDEMADALLLEREQKEVDTLINKAVEILKYRKKTNMDTARKNEFNKINDRLKELGKIQGKKGKPSSAPGNLPKNVEYLIKELNIQI